MDKIDLIILKELSIDTRIPFRKIAKKAGVSTQTIIKRYHAMKKNGTIEYCSITVDLHSIGFAGSAGLLLTSQPDSNITDIIKKIIKIKNIIGATPTFGDYEGYAILVFKNIQDLFSKVTEIKKIPGLSKMEISITDSGHRFFPPNDNLNILKLLSPK